MVRLLAGATALVALVGGWWALARWSVETGAGAGERLPYSVLVSSVVTRARAARLARRLPGAFVSPVAAEGTIHWRVFVGSFPDREEARRELERLVRRGVKDRARREDVRPARFALLLGRWSAAAAVRRARRELGEDAIFTYVLREGTSRQESSGDGSYLLYAGAFEERRASAWLDGALREEGHRAQLMIRRGEPR